MVAVTQANPSGVEVRVPVSPEFAEILTPEALEFLTKLQRAFDAQRRELIKRRALIQAQLDQGWTPDFLPETLSVRESDWMVGHIPKDLRDRRVEIGGPVDRWSVVACLNSGARVYLADFEDAHSPTWSGTLAGQLNLRDAVRGTISVEDENGQTVGLVDTPAVLMMRPRGWHLTEKHVRIDGLEASASLFDFGLYLFHNAQALLDKGSGPYFYLPKIENHLEARLWNQVFELAERELNLPPGSIKATVLIENVLAIFEMDEILHELKDHCLGLNCGRSDYIFSFIKTFRNREDCVLPDRDQVNMLTHFLRSYSLLTIRTCHRRGAFAIGSMATLVPDSQNPENTATALDRVVKEKLREVQDGHDGSWVAHPSLVPTVMRIFDDHMPQPNQLNRKREDVFVMIEDMLTVPEGTITEACMRRNVQIGLRYLESWLGGKGCIEVMNRVTDASSCEVARAQLWQWIHHDRGILTDGRKVSLELFRTILAEEFARIRDELGPDQFVAERWDQARDLFNRLVCHEPFYDYLTEPAYEILES